jgi:hypothetical protein
VEDLRGMGYGWDRDISVYYFYRIEDVFISEELEEEDDRNGEVAVYPDGREIETAIEVYRIKGM